ncbi:hypothetical protein C8R45DRAFT_1164063 [Mycena sanguinolenta]|nr:hypothetical protein C8R45DRAFT_1164063 [Mycena sanguinolenta]
MAVPHTQQANSIYRLIGTWINCILFTLELTLAMRYFQRSSRPLLHRVGIAAMVMADILCTFAICAQIYMLVPCQPTCGHQTYSLEALAVIICSTYATASIAQLFLCNLYFILTRRRMISAILIFTVVVHLHGLAGIFVCIGDFDRRKRISLGLGLIDHQSETQRRIGAISCAVTDSMIAAALLDTFIRLDKASAFRVSTHNLLRRLIIVSFSSGVIVASTTLISLILTLNGKPGRVYALTILGNFAVGAREQKTQTVATAPTPSALTVVFHFNHTSVRERDVRICEHSCKSTNVALRLYKH